MEKKVWVHFWYLLYLQVYKDISPLNTEKEANNELFIFSEKLHQKIQD